MANQVLTIDGEERSLASLTEQCQSITGDPAAQIACFNTLSKLLEEQSSGPKQNEAVIAEKLDALRSVAQYQDAESGLLIGGSDCSIQILYYGNYFHISRRNVSTIDLVSVELDVSRMQLDQTAQVQGAQVPTLRGTMQPGGMATIRGGMALDSSLDGFPPRSPRASLDAYANEVTGLLEAKQAPVFDFVLIHPKRGQAGGEIWKAFQSYALECQG